MACHNRAGLARRSFIRQVDVLANKKSAKRIAAQTADSQYLGHSLQKADMFSMWPHIDTHRHPAHLQQGATASGIVRSDE